MARRRRQRPREPRRVSRRYERGLVAVSRAIAELVDGVVQPHLARARAREDADIDPNLFGTDFANLRIRVGRLTNSTRVRNLVDRWGREIRDVNRVDQQRILRISLAEESTETRQILRTLRRENVDLITSIGTRHLDDTFRTVTNGVIRGTRVETLAKEIKERHGVSESRARLIARDQTLKANSQLTQARHREAEVERYVWSSSRDERVRDIHGELDGRTFSWNDPPVTNEAGEQNHPGEDYQCRCVAIPVLDP